MNSRGVNGDVSLTDSTSLQADNTSMLSDDFDIDLDEEEIAKMVEEMKLKKPQQIGEDDEDDWEKWE